MKYEIRTENGMLVAHIANSLALKIMQNCPGHFRTRHTESGDKICFETNEQMQLIYPDIVMYLGKGYILQST